MISTGGSNTERYTERLTQVGIDASVGSVVGDSYGNTLAENIISVFFGYIAWVSDTNQDSEQVLKETTR